MSTHPDARTVAGKALVQRLIAEVMNDGDLAVLEELCTPPMARAAAGWIGRFRDAFPDVHTEIVQLVAESDAVAGRFRCSATHLGTWRGQAPTGRRFTDVDEVYFLMVTDGRISCAWGLEDTLSRLRQLGLTGEQHDCAR